MAGHEVRIDENGVLFESLGDVHDDAGHRYDRHDPRLHLRRIHEPPDRRVDDQKPDHDERDPVCLRGEDLRASEAERPAPARR